MFTFKKTSEISNLKLAMQMPNIKCQIIKIVKKVEKYREILTINSIFWKMI
jgi:hypothetical protein